MKHVAHISKRMPAQAQLDDLSWLTAGPKLSFGANELGDIVVLIGNLADGVTDLWTLMPSQVGKSVGPVA